EPRRSRKTEGRSEVSIVSCQMFLLKTRKQTECFKTAVIRLNLCRSPSIRPSKQNPASRTLLMAAAAARLTGLARLLPSEDEPGLVHELGKHISYRNSESDKD